ncbi:RNA-binding protein, UPB1 [Strigomonas culicis]|uniref:RNA-binding protein, UPB1 n=1 Tax=Strigomonas culicis TaxID=28005 RepID=S9U1T1_9TRYP|nr:RNA-binding protein, UPB1 [Strigomonas culicis]|eukprot:EPY22883.1 RNA-binding protein, UPB1 [Strigomonas culicis]
MIIHSSKNSLICHSACIIFPFCLFLLSFLRFIRFPLMSTVCTRYPPLFFVLLISAFYSFIVSSIYYPPPSTSLMAQMVPQQAAYNAEPEYMRNLMVNYIPTNVDDVQLRNLFERFGPIDKVKIVCDRETRQSRGYGFVMFQSAASAQQAINEMNGYNILNKRLKVALAAPGNQRQRGNFQQGQNPMYYNGGNFAAPYAQANPYAQQQQMMAMQQQYMMQQAAQQQPPR